MPDRPPVPQSPLQAPIVQMALDLAGKLEAHARQAPLGGVLDACESLLLGHGRQFLRDSLAAALQQPCRRRRKKGGPRAAVLADSPAATRGPARANC